MERVSDASLAVPEGADAGTPVVDVVVSSWDWPMLDSAGAGPKPEIRATPTLPPTIPASRPRRPLGPGSFMMWGPLICVGVRLETHIGRLPAKAASGIP